MKQNNFLRLVLFIGLFVSFHLAEAAHIVGGEVTYTHLSYNSNGSRVTYRINVTMYRDHLNEGSIFDTSETLFGIFRENDEGGWDLYDQVAAVNHTTPVRIPPNDDPCVIEPVGTVGVEEASYIFDITVEVGDLDYMVAYQRCCRNVTISNLINPEETGAVFDIVITAEAQKQENDSPVFSSYPPIFICGDFPILVDQSATDVDGDSLAYAFCSPFTSGGILNATSPSTITGCCDCVRPAPIECGPPFDEVVFRPPFDQNMPLGGSPQVSIDAKTGVIIGTPQVTGQFVVGVCVTEYRNGVAIGKVRRDFQFNVLTCDRQVSAALESDDIVVENGTQFYVVNSCGDSVVRFNNLSTDPNFIRSYDWEFYKEGSLVSSQEGGSELRDVDITFPGTGTYGGVMIVNRQLDCADTANILVNLYPAIDAVFDFDYDTCVAGPVVFSDYSFTGGDMITSWEWLLESDAVSNDQNPDYIYSTPGLKDVRLIVADNNECEDTLNQVVSYFPAPATIIVEPSNFIGCTPSEIFLNNLSSPIDSSYSIRWDFGDGTVSSDISPVHVYTVPGQYSLSLDIVSPIGCPIGKRFDNWIDIKESPVADFNCFPEEPTVFNKTVSFTDKTDKAGAWLWDFGGESSAFDKNPTYTFLDTGIYIVRLTAYHPITNCPDTISKTIDVTPTVEFHFPNAFTPNNDASNDLFLGNGYYEGLSDFKISVWNRWGQQIFETNDPMEGWNGQENNAGKPSPQGVYVYKAEYKSPRGQKYLQEGHVTLLR